MILRLPLFLILLKKKLWWHLLTVNKSLSRTIALSVKTITAEKIGLNFKYNKDK